MDLRHETFTVTVRLDADPAAVFAAFADESRWRRWVKLPGKGATYDHDFRVGGGESAHSTFAHLDGTTESLDYRSRFIDIVPDSRIVYGYESSVDGVLRWTSLVTVHLRAEADGTELSWTEQAAFLVLTDHDGSQDLAHLRGGTRLRLNGLATAVAD